MKCDGPISVHIPSAPIILSAQSTILIMPEIGFSSVRFPNLINRPTSPASAMIRISHPRHPISPPNLVVTDRLGMITIRKGSRRKVRNDQSLQKSIYAIKNVSCFSGRLIDRLQVLDLTASQ